MPPAAIGKMTAANKTRKYFRNSDRRMGAASRLIGPPEATDDTSDNSTPERYPMFLWIGIGWAVPRPHGGLPTFPPLLVARSLFLDRSRPLLARPMSFRKWRQNATFTASRQRSGGGATTPLRQIALHRGTGLETLDPQVIMLTSQFSSSSSPARH